VVPLVWGNVVASDESCGHAILSPRPFRVRDWADYRRKLKARGIELQLDERRLLLERELAAGAARSGGQLVENPSLCVLHARRCEIPGVVAVSLPEDALALPRDIVHACIEERLTSFAIESGDALLPAFLAVMDRSDDPRGFVQRGFEALARAVLRDVRDAYERDREVPLAERQRRLQSRGCPSGPGTVGEKAERLATLCDLLCRELRWEEERDAAREAAWLLKADLGTLMVREFPALAGRIGGHYARREGYAEKTWMAIADQYRPTFPGDGGPRGRVGRVVGLADRIDTLVGRCGQEGLPSGRRDPFDLRGVAQGLVRIVLAGDLDLDLDLVAARAVRLYGQSFNRRGEEVLAELRPFLSAATRSVLAGEGFGRDEIEAVLAAGGNHLPDVRSRLRAIRQLRSEPGFRRAVATARRLREILGDAPEAVFEPRLIVEEAEEALYRASEQLRGPIEKALANGDDRLWLREVAGRLAPALERFLAHVLVRDEDHGLRANRLGLLHTIERQLSRRIRLSELDPGSGSAD
jgi:glycyl-tRNA synthetase beta chain